MKKLKRPVLVRTEHTYTELQMLMKHPVTGEDFSFDICEGQAKTDDPHVLRCLLDHPRRNGGNAPGSFFLVGSDKELEDLYTEATGNIGHVDPLEAANKEIEALQKKVSVLEAKAKK